MKYKKIAKFAVYLQYWYVLFNCNIQIKKYNRLKQFWADASAMLKKEDDHQNL